MADESFVIERVGRVIHRVGAECDGEQRHRKNRSASLNFFGEGKSVFQEGRPLK